FRMNDLMEYYQLRLRRLLRASDTGNASGCMVLQSSWPAVKTSERLNSSDESCCRSTSLRFSVPAACHLRKPDSPSTVGTESFTSKCTGGMRRSLLFGIDCRCLREVFTGMRRFFRVQWSWRSRRVIAVRVGPRWLAPKDAIVLRR